MSGTAKEIAPPVGCQKDGILQGQIILRGDPPCLCPEDWLMGSSQADCVLADGFRHGEVVREGNAPWLRFEGRRFWA